MAEPASILIVDDEPKICQFLEVLLRREGYNPVSVNSAGEALAIAQRQKFDLVLTDLKMPGMDGFELITRLKADAPTLPIIMITGYATVETAVRAMRYGVDDYVTKPFNIDELQKVISRTLQSARIERENKELLARLQEANAELARQRKALAEKVRKTGSELEAVRSQLRRQELHAAVLGDVSAVVATEHDLEKLLERVVATLSERLDARFCSVMLREGDALVVRACEGERARELIGMRESLEHSVAGRVAVSQQPLLVKHAASEAALLPTPGRKYRTASCVCAPIVHRGAAFGVICVSDRHSGLPFDEKDLETVLAAASQIAPAIETASLYRALEERCVSVITGLVAALEGRDRFTRGHSRRVCEYATALATAAGCSPREIEILHKAAHLHDIGQIAISDRIMCKPDRLNGAERELVQRHPLTGEHIVEPLDFLRQIRPIIRHHHERPDGAGYPDGLRGDDIPRLARFLTIADAFDAMTSERPWRPAMTFERAAEELKSNAGRQFDESLVTLFCKEVLTKL